METVISVVLFAIFLTILYVIYKAAVLSEWAIDVIIEIAKWVEKTDNSPRKG